MKRVTWFVTGVAAGATGANYAARKVRRTASLLAPANVAKGAANQARRSGRRVVDAVKEGRAAMTEREDELRARRDARIEPLDDRLGVDEQIMVDGRLVDSARVIVLKQRS